MQYICSCGLVSELTQARLRPEVEKLQVQELKVEHWSVVPTRVTYLLDESKYEERHYLESTK